MTHSLSDARRHHRLHPADPAQPVCAYRSSVRKPTAGKAICTAMPAYPTASAIVSAVMHTFSQTPDTAVAPNVCALSP